MTEEQKAIEAQRAARVPVPVASRVSNKRTIEVNPGAIILQALGGYTAEQEENAKKVVDALNAFCFSNQFVIVSNGRGKPMRFVAKEDLPELYRKN